MNNYENNKKEVDIIFGKNSLVAVDRNTNKLSTCHDLTCEDCLFFRKYNNGTHCTLSCAKWLVSEYEEPKVDWSKVPVDTPVLASMDGEKWYAFHFAGVDRAGNTYVYPYGRTSWSNKDRCDNENTKVPYIKLAEVE